MSRRFISVLRYVLIFGISPTFLFAVQQDTVRLSVTDAEQQFFRANAQLLASKFSISASRAAELQAGLWSNPTLSLGQNIYNKETGRAIDFTKTGNTDISVQQLFLLAGKRDKQITLAVLNTKMAEQNYNALMRALKYELHSDCTDLYFLQRQLAFYDQNIPQLRKTIESLEKLYENHSILLSELLRIKALLLSLESGRQDVVTRISQFEGDIRVLLNDTTAKAHYYVPVFDDTVLLQSLDSTQVTRLTELALEARPDLKLADLAVRYEENNLSYQKSLAIPDVYLGASYSRSGSYISDYFGVTLQVDLPFFNRNQGNIEVSNNTLLANQLALAGARLSLRREVEVAFNKALEADRVYRGLDRTFYQQYAALVTGTIASYQKRNITAIDFTDFWESYRNVVLQCIQIENNKADALDGLDFVVGREWRER